MDKLMQILKNPLYNQLFKRHEESQKTFIHFSDGQELTYSSFIERSQRYAQIFSEYDLICGDRIAFQLDKSVECLSIVAASIQIGCIFLPLNPDYRGEEVEFFLKDSDAKLFICDPKNIESIQVAQSIKNINIETMDRNGGGTLPSKERVSPRKTQVAERDENDIAALLYTSGTTGRSKGAMLTHRNLISNAQVLRDAWKFTSQDILLHALPIFHTHGLFVATNLTLLTGSSMIFLPKFEVGEVTRLIEKATVMMGVPTFYVRLLGSNNFNKERTKSIRLFVSGSAPLLAETHKSFEEKTGHKILERYGMTETNMNTSNPYYGLRKPGTVGQTLQGVELKIVDEEGVSLKDGDVGNILVKGENVFKGYWNLPEKTKEDFTEDGFFKTGDLGRKDKAGYVEIVGRNKDLIISGGFNIFPKEIELAIDQTIGVMESAVIGVAHKDFGEGVLAVIVKKENSEVNKSIIQEFLKKKLAKYKQPKEVIFVKELPRNSMGKVQKNILRQTYSDHFSN